MGYHLLLLFLYFLAVKNLFTMLEQFDNYKTNNKKSQNKKLGAI